MPKGTTLDLVYKALYILHQQSKYFWIWKYLSSEKVTLYNFSFYLNIPNNIKINNFIQKFVNGGF